MNKQNQKIIIAAGGTGGHLSPALAIADILSNKGHSITLYTDTRCKNYLPNDIPYNIIINKNYPFSKNPIKFIIFISLLIKNIFIISRKIHLDKTDLIISFGGYTSAAVNFSTIITSRKLIIHEQNAVLGRQNKFFIKFADCIAYSFPNTRGLEKIKQKKKIHTGLPVRNNFTASNIVNHQKFVILIIGGSQGAQFLGIKLIKILKTLDQSILLNIRIIHQVRPEHLKEAKIIYKNLKINYEIQSYFPDMHNKFKEADLIVSRAGAASLSEIIYAQKASILIPYPSAKDNHQYFNAKYLADNNATIMFNENNFNTRHFTDTILKFIQNPEFKEEIERNVKNMYSFSDNKELADLIISQSYQQSRP